MMDYFQVLNLNFSINTSHIIIGKQKKWDLRER